MTGSQNNARKNGRHVRVRQLNENHLRLSKSSSKQLFDDVRSQIAIQPVLYYVILYCLKLVPFRFRIFLLQMIK